MPESVFTQTMPLLLAGGVCCCAAGAGLAGAEDAAEWDGAGIAVDVGLVVAGADELAGVELAAEALAAEVSADADFFERDFFGAAASVAPALALSAVSADFFERDFFFVVAEESAVVELSDASADFLERVFFLGVASASVEADAASVESALLFFERLFLLPASAAELSAVLVEPSADSADFLDRLFFVADLLLSAVALSVESARALFLERLFLVVEESAAAELSAAFFLDLDLAFLVESAESEVLCEESSAWAFFLALFFVLVELSL